MQPELRERPHRLGRGQTLFGLGAWLEYIEEGVILEARLTCLLGAEPRRSGVFLNLTQSGNVLHSACLLKGLIDTH